MFCCRNDFPQYRLYLLCILLGSLCFAAKVHAAGGEQFGSNFPIVFPLLAPKLSSEYGLRKHPVFKTVKHHSGVDLAAPKDSHVRVIMPGQVIFADRLGSYGKLVSVVHADGYVSMYGHLDEILVLPGQRVAAGDIVGRVGSTGRATGPHLHFEWRKNGKALDPLKAFPALGSQAEG